MGTYELDDALVQEFLGTLHESEDALPSGKLGKELQKQVPLPTPTKLAAVVRTIQNVCFIRWAYDAHTHEPWIAHSSVDETYRTDEIGRITAVLSEGVDL